MLLNAPYQREIVIGAEVLSKLVDWQERSTAGLFCDGSGVILVEQTESNSIMVVEELVAFGKSGSTLNADYLPLNQFLVMINLTP